jgi:hydrogenase nickel incorporation protein HypB
MCDHCGCSGESAPVPFGRPALRAHGHGTTLRLEQDVLAKNDRLAGENRARLRARRIAAFNLVSSPGSGKTTLLVRTIRDLGGRLGISVIEGDQETSRDADRVRETGVPVVQVNTGTGCHLDAHLVAHALETLAPPEGSAVVIENVGNLICPALFDLGEEKRVLVASVTEGEEKPLKYPHMFRSADLVLLNKVDLLPHVEFSVDRFAAHVREVNPRASVLRVSATRGDGMGEWTAWLLDAAGCGVTA